MNRFTRIASLLTLTLAGAAAPALAQGVPYDRGIDDLAYVPGGGGAGGMLTGRFTFNATAPQDHNLGFGLALFVNGAQVGDAQPVELFARPGCPTDFCWTCRGVCFNFGIVCICITLREGEVDPVGRFALPAPILHPGDVVSLQMRALPGALPEIDTSNDSDTTTVPGAGCPADFTGDGVVNSQDFFAFLTAFFQGSPAADFNGDGAINSQDFFNFLGAFFNGC